jgi:hypothetical protein
MKWIISLGIILITISCSDKQLNNTDVFTINVKVDNNVIDNPFPYHSYVILNTPDSVILGEINKLQIMGGNIYITDNQRQSIFCFDIQGNYLRNLSRQGRSDKEYIRIEDFEVVADNTICVYDSEQRKIIVYDSEGNFIRLTPAINGIAFKLLIDGAVAFNRGNGAATIDRDQDQQLFNYAYVKGNDIAINAVPFDKMLEGRRFFLGQTKNFFYEWNGEIFMSSMLNNTIFKINKHNGHIEPYIAFDIGNEISANTESKLLLRLADDIMKGKSASFPYNFQENGNMLMTMYNYDMRPHTFIYDTETGNCINGIISSNKYGLPFLPISYLDSDNSGKIITLLEPHNIELFLNLAKKKGLDTSLLEEIEQKMTKNDNTILIFNNWPENLLLIH